MKDIKTEFYKNHDKIEVPVCFYEDDDGNKVFDLEAMAEEFQNELTKVVGVTVMCSVYED